MRALHVRADLISFVIPAHNEEALIAHHWAKGRLWWPGWDGALVPLPQDVLVSEAKSKTYDGLWLREPGQFLHHALPRARAFLDRFGPPPG